MWYYFDTGNLIFRGTYIRSFILSPKTGFNPLKGTVSIIWKPCNSFAIQINNRIYVIEILKKAATTLNPLNIADMTPKQYSFILVFSRSKRVYYGTIIPAGITWNKMWCYMLYSACRWLTVENAKMFRSYIKHFWVFPREEIVKSWLVYVNKYSWIIQSCFLSEAVKQSLCQHGTIIQKKKHVRKFFYKSLLNSAWLWSRARLATNKKRKYFSLPHHQRAENLIFVSGL